MDFTLDPDEKWVACQRCRKRLRSLAKYKPEDVSLDAPELGPLGNMSGKSFEGMIASLTLIVVTCFLSCVGESAATRYRSGKVARLKREVLPSYPKSLICPRCLKVTRER